MEPLRRIIYTSEVSSGHKPSLDDLHRLITGARHFNTLNGITGMLWSDNNKFVQAIEGTESAIHEVMGRIEGDPLHKNIDIVINMPVNDRGFGDWSMAFQTKEFTDQGVPFLREVVKPEIIVVPYDWTSSLRKLGMVAGGSAIGSVIAKLLLH